MKYYLISHNSGRGLLQKFPNTNIFLTFDLYHFDWVPEGTQSGEMSSCEHPALTYGRKDIWLDS